MQNDIGSVVARNLNGDNEQIRQLVEIVKQQAQEIKNRGNRIMDLEDKNEMLQKNLTILANSNKQLESMIDSLRTERTKLLEEIEALKTLPEKPVAVLKSKKQKTKTTVEAATE